MLSNVTNPLPVTPNTPSIAAGDPPTTSGNAAKVRAFSSATPGGPSDRPDNASQPDIHYLRPNDTLSTLAITYGVSFRRLLDFNLLPFENMLYSRSSIRIPPESAKRSVSTTMPGDAEARMRSVKLLRLMQTCKVKREVAEVYLDQAGWDLGLAMRKWEEDEVWEREHPMKGAGKEVVSPLKVAKLLR